ncbi:MAG TPA: hypothetical protein PKB10_04300, partial [Tepidisphaeraceae bacterium]|nr:hypothetical protein [Tepidisphaeraceae bacterium]
QERVQLGGEDLLAAGLTLEDLGEVGDQGSELGEGGRELIPLEAGEPGEPLEIVEVTPGAKQSYIDLRDAAESLQGAIARFLHVINSRRADQAGDL